MGGAFAEDPRCGAVVGGLGGGVARGREGGSELWHDQTMDSEGKAEDGADSWGASSSDGGCAEAVFAEGQDEARGRLAATLPAGERQKSAGGQGGEYPD